MAINTKTINRRIKSIVSTRKITKAMELVAASKMRKAVAAVLASRPYATMAWETVDRLRGTRIGKPLEDGADESEHPLLAARPRVRKSLAVLVTSDRGLCGGFNAQVLKTAAEYVRKRPGVAVGFVTVGKRGEAFVRRRGLPLVASFGSLLSQPTATNVRPLARLLTDAFIKGECDEVVLIYTDFVSAILQKPRVKTLLPLKKDADLGQAASPISQTSNLKPQTSSETLFEPDPATVLDRMLPRIAEIQLYQSLLESLASEHSARMLAMRNATDSASEMLDDLRFTFNQARQAGITQEIAEIAAGAAALTA